MSASLSKEQRRRSGVSTRWLVAEVSGTQFKMSSSTLIETVSLNYEDFSESFLTCSTCLCPYDQQNHRPKLLHCSHTVCGSCLERIAQLSNNQEGTVRCPICREAIPIPSGGIPNLPPSFLVNQLIDLMQRQRRDIVPKCSSHPAEELLFCETCDTVFCPSCSDPSDVNSGCHNHTIVPFSIAIKRMSEILLYKANQCVKNLDRAASNVQREMDSLDGNVDQIVDEVNSSFHDLTQLLDRRRRGIVEEVRRVRNEKRKVLRDQLGIIQSEKAKVEQECNGLEHQVEVRNITQKISDLNAKLDTTLTLIEPRENAFLRYDCSTGEVLKGLQTALGQFGALSVSRTFPPLCTAVAEPGSVHTESTVFLTTIDYHGHYRSTGGDPIEASVVPLDEIGQEDPGVISIYDRSASLGRINNNNSLSVLRNICAVNCLKVTSVDNGDGTYSLKYRAPSSGQYRMDIKIFNRPIKTSPLIMTVSPHHNPIWQFGCAGSDVYQLRQPVRVHCGPSGQIYILDTGNNRMKVLTCDGSFVRHVSGESISQQSAVGLALIRDRSRSSSPASAETSSLGDVTGFATLNWRTRSVTEWTADGGRENRSFTFSEFVEPIDLAVDSRGRILVADNGARKVFIFDAQARPVLSFPVNAQQLTSPSKANTLPANHHNHNSSISPSQPGTGGKRTGHFAAPVVNHVTCVAVGMNDDILVGGSDGIQLYDGNGKFIRSISISNSDTVSGKHVGGLVIGGIAVDPSSGIVVSTIIDRNRTYVAVSHYKGDFRFPIDSHSSKLKRPSGICIAEDKQHCLVADLGNHCIKKYRYI